MKSRSQREADDLRPDYAFDYSKAVRGKYFHRLMKEGSNIVVLDPDVAKRFRSSAAVNEALRKLLSSHDQRGVQPRVRTAAKETRRARHSVSSSQRSRISSWFAQIRS
jgi:hypothetical protein